MTMMVTIKEGTYRNAEVHNQTFELVSDITDGKKGPFITVRPNDTVGIGRDKIRVHVHADNVQYNTTKVAKETDDEIMDRIKDRFDILEEMTAAAIESNIRAMIVVGPPGVGKSYGVIKQLEKADLFNKVKTVVPRYEVIKGAMTPIGLYKTLYTHSDANQVIVFDDCDSIFMDDLSLNLLKAALDSSKKRRIFWNSDSSLLRREGIPDSFDFKGSVIFITNLKFDNIKSKRLQDHLQALQSRCHYLDLSLNSTRDMMLRIKQIHREGELFDDYHFEANEPNAIIEFMEENVDNLRELSLRSCLKIADLIKINPTRWQKLAANTVMKNSY